MNARTQRISAGRRLIAPNVVALPSAARNAVVNPERHGRSPGNVQGLHPRLGLQRGAVAQLKAPPGNPNRGAVVRLIRQDDAGDWYVEGVHAPLALADGGFALAAWLPRHRLHGFTDQKTVLRKLRDGRRAAIEPADAAPAWWPFSCLDLARLRRLTERQLLQFEGACLYVASQAGFALFHGGRCLNRPALALVAGGPATTRPSAESGTGWPFNKMDLGLVQMLTAEELDRLEGQWIKSAVGDLGLDVVEPEHRSGVRPT